MSLSGSKGYDSSFRGASAPSAYAQVLTSDFGTIQNSLPSVVASDSYGYCFKIPNTGSQWRSQSCVHFVRPDQITETVGVGIESCDVVQPTNPGWNGTVYSPATITGQTINSAACTVGIYMVLNGYLYQATNTGSGTQATSPLAPGAFNRTKGATTTDGTVVWTSCGKAVLIVARFSNATAVAAVPTAMQYDFFAV
jgi:hypothetical protein